MTMEKSIVFLIAVIISLHCNSQESIYRLHPLVGDTIDKNEKFNYLLFKNIKDADFKYGILTRTNDTCFLKICSPDNTVSTLAIDSTELEQYITKLDMVQEYNANQGKKDSLQNNLNPEEEASKYKELNSSLIDKHSREKIIKEVRAKNRMDEDAERYNNRMKGTDITGGGYIEIPAVRSKKHK